MPRNGFLIPLSLAAAIAAGCQSPTTATAPSLDAPEAAPVAAGAPLATEPSRRLAIAETAPVLTATASASASAFPPARAIDGSLSTEWQSGMVANPVFTLDRGASGPLTALALKNKPGQVFAVDVSVDGATWKTVLVNQQTATWNLETKALPADTAGRYVRLRYATPGTASVMLFEAKLTGSFDVVATPAPSAEPITAVLTAAGAPTASLFPASRAVDASLSTEWQSGAVATSALTLDRGATGSLTALDVKMNPGPVFDVLVSDDAATWTPALAAQKTATWNVERKTLPAGTAGRYVKLAITNNGKSAMVFEARPQGTLAGATPTTAPTVAPTATPTPVATATPAPITTPAPVGGFVPTRFGNQSVPRSADGTHTRGYELIQELGMSTIREGWNWANLQTEKGKLVSWIGAYTDPKTAKLASLGLATEAMVTDTPSWAASDPNAPNKKSSVPAGLNQAIFADGTDVYKPGVGVNPNNYFAWYMYTMVSRYKGQVASWQVWNEPDFPSGQTTAGYYGTNGAPRYWNGTVQEYVRLLKVAHTIVKGIDPAARVALGGLGYENYLAAIIDNGGAPYFDIMDFHAYGSDKTTANGVLNTSWGFLGRYQAMKNVLAAKGVTGKTFAVSETGMTADKPEEQAGYAMKVLAAGQGLGDVELVQWAVFTNPGHLNIGVIDKATLSVKTKGYHAYAFASRQLAGARPAGAVTDAGAQGWKFVRPDGKAQWAVWSKSTAAATVNLPSMSGRVLDKYGATRMTSFAGGSLSVSSDPVWVVEN